MKIPHKYNLKSKQTEEFLRQLSRENRVRKYIGLLKKYHPGTFNHSYRVALLCVDLGFENGFQEKEMNLLGYAGLLHDIGKVKIPLEVLNKDSTLTSFERELIEGHVYSESGSVNEFGYNLKRMIVSHHEYQIQPYPRKVQDRRKHIRNQIDDRRKKYFLIKDLTQILAVADLYDALRNERAYKSQKSKDEAKKIMMEQFMGNQKYIEQIILR
jgi:HD-GYP domain-containing protein (c-di-GMP phosphodiesterase class II)